MQEDSRHPYSYACDFIRRSIGYNLSRAQASTIMTEIANVIGMDDEELASKLSDAYTNKAHKNLKFF